MPPYSDALSTSGLAICAIHQPNFFPWLGYFDKIDRADAFVFLDRVDYPRSGSSGMGSWTNRVRVNLQGEARWIGAPVRRSPLGTPIGDICVDDSQPWREKLLRSLDQSYRKAPGRMAAIELLEPLVRYPSDRLSDININAITVIAAALGKTTRFLRQSELPHEGTATELLISLVKAAGCSAYLAGGGAGGYQEDDLFRRSGVELVYQGFEQKPYGDATRFLPGLSVIDYLMQTSDQGQQL